VTKHSLLAHQMSLVGRLGGDGMTQSGRVLHALNIDIICFNSSQAKRSRLPVPKPAASCSSISRRRRAAFRETVVSTRRVDQWTGGQWNPEAPRVGDRRSSSFS